MYIFQVDTCWSSSVDAAESTVSSWFNLISASKYSAVNEVKIDAVFTWYCYYIATKQIKWIS